jgi:hypothetical protein
METTAVSLGKAVLDGVLGYAKSVAAEEIALQFGVERDVGFITDELEMMQSLLKTADEEDEREHKHNQVRTTWVKQVRDLAYNVSWILQSMWIWRSPTACGAFPATLTTVAASPWR